MDSSTMFFLNLITCASMVACSLFICYLLEKIIFLWKKVRENKIHLTQVRKKA